MHPRPRRRTLLAGTSLALAGAALPAQAAPPPSKPGRGRACGLTTSPLTATARPHAELNELFTAYGDTGEGWTGADTTNSVPLRSGETAWIFSDTFLGPVFDDGTRPQDTPFLNNSLIIQSGPEPDDLRTVHGTSADGSPSGIVGPLGDDVWHWFGAGYETPDRRLQISTLQFTRHGEGQWDWGWTGSELTTVDPSTGAVLDSAPLPSDTEIQWSAWIERIGGHVYVYGCEDLGAEKYLHVAKVLGGDMAALHRWRYWNGTGWSRDEADSARIHDHVANELSVTPYRDGYVLITQDTSLPFNPQIVAAFACTPTGPFTDAIPVWTMPETGPDGIYGNPNIYGYNAHEHPQLRDGDTLVVSYNVNSLVPDELYDDVTIYRPRFIEVDLTTA